MTTHTRQAIIAIGMHRSGISAFAGAAVRLGASPPAQVMPPAPGNPTGFWEAQAITQVNDSLLQAAGCRWDTCGDLDADTYDDGARRIAYPFVRATLASQFGHASLFVLKDARLSLTLPIWLDALDDLGIAPFVVLMLRHPGEVMQSLARHNAMPPELAARLWLHHTLQAEHVSRELPRIVLSYDNLMRDWQGCLERIGCVAGIDWPNPPGRITGGAPIFARLRHFSAAAPGYDATPPALGDRLAETWRVMRAIERNGDRASLHASLDAMRGGFPPMPITRLRATA